MATGRRIFPTVATSFWLLALFFWTVTCDAAELACKVRGVKVEADIDADARSACEGARNAITFLNSQGFRIPDSISITLVEKMPDDVAPSALGAYFKSERRIMILYYGVFVARREWYRIPIDRDVYRSVVSHEVAHAVATHNFRMAQPSMLAEEYVGYVVLFSTMPATYRERVLELYPDNDAADDTFLRDPAVYMIDPIRFGANAYRHYLRPGNGAAFLRAVLTGAALAE